MPTLATKIRPKKIKIGPADHGRRMSLDDFDEAEAAPGFLYELNKGVIEVSGIPNLKHGQQVEQIRDQLSVFKSQHPGIIQYVGGGNEAKMLIGPEQSERHPDVSIYLKPPLSEKDIWSTWVPEIVVEVVSDRSATRDYDEKPAEYLAFGVDEYWIIDAAKKQMTAHSRWRGQWKTKQIKSTQKYTTPRLPGFMLDLAKVLAASS